VSFSSHSVSSTSPKAGETPSKSQKSLGKAVGGEVGSNVGAGNDGGVEEAEVREPLHEVGHLGEVPLDEHVEGEVHKGEGLAEDEGSAMLGDDLVQLLKVDWGPLGIVDSLGLLVLAKDHHQSFLGGITEGVLGIVEGVLLNRVGAVETLNNANKCWVNGVGETGKQGSRSLTEDPGKEPVDGDRLRQGLPSNLHNGELATGVPSGLDELLFQGRPVLVGDPHIMVSDPLILKDHPDDLLGGGRTRCGGGETEETEERQRENENTLNQRSRRD